MAFGVSCQAVHAIVLGRTWAHLPVKILEEVVAPSEQAKKKAPMPRRTEKPRYHGDLDKALSRIEGGLDVLGMFLDRGWDDADFDQWSERVAASHAKLGSLLDLMRKPTCPTIGDR